MKPISIICALAFGALTAGCVSEGKDLVLDPVGPQPAMPVAAMDRQTGTLVVYSAYAAGPNFNGRQPDFPVYSDYKILSRDGSFLRSVHNDSGTIQQEAMPVALAPGAYRVVANANGYGRVTVPVIIKTHQMTVLHLEGGVSWPGESGCNQTNAVHLPDGEVVGWRASS